MNEDCQIVDNMQDGCPVLKSIFLWAFATMPVMLKSVPSGTFCYYVEKCSYLCKLKNQ